MTAIPADAASALAKFKVETGATNVPWVDSPFFPHLLPTLGLDPEMERIARDFARDGYVIIDPEIPDEIIERTARDLRNRFVPTYEPYYADQTRIQDGWIFSQPVKEIASAPRVLEILKALYQREAIPFQTLNFCVGSQQRTHSDTIHFDSIPQGFMCGAWVALEDVDANNGPLHYYPGSQKLPIYNMSDIGISASLQSHPYDNYSKYEDFVEALMLTEELQRAEIRVKRGQCLIWAANLFHGGSPIIDSSRSRLTQVTHYYFSGCLYYTPLLSDAAIGKMFVRKSVNVVTGQLVPQYYNGLQVENPGEWPPKLAGVPSAMEEHPIVEPPRPTRFHQRFLGWLARPDASVRS
ncbi:MAG: phytanoyl-CoA dioxygenase family protein [Acidobacteriota bacterium]